VEPLIAKAIAVDPANPEIQQVKSALYRHAWAWNEARDAARIARRLDPMRAGLIDREAIIGLCSNRPSEALELYRSLVMISPRAALGHGGVARSLARLGKWDEAVAELRIAWPPKTARDSALRDTLARGELGYWQLIHADGKPRLDETLARVREGKWVAPMRIAFDQMAAGEIDAGLDEMAKAAAKGDVAVYRAVCQPNADEARSWPRFWQILESLPKWDLARPVPRPRLPAACARRRTPGRRSRSRAGSCRTREVRSPPPDRWGHPSDGRRRRANLRARRGHRS